MNGEVGVFLLPQVLNISHTGAVAKMGHQDSRFMTKTLLKSVALEISEDSLRAKREQGAWGTGPEFACRVFDGIGLADRLDLKSLYESMVCRYAGPCWILD